MFLVREITRSPNDINIPTEQEGVRKKARPVEQINNGEAEGSTEVVQDKIWVKLEEILEEIRRNKKENEERFDKLQKVVEEEKIERDREREHILLEVKQLRTQLRKYEERLEDYENRSRRQNLIVKGIKEKTGETWEETESKVKAVVKEKYDLELQGIARAHRFGSQGGEWPRPIMVRFEKEKERERILKGRRKLKGSKVFIDEDFAPATRQKRKKLLDIMKEKRKEGRRAFVKVDKLVVDGEDFMWNELEEKLEKVKSRSSKKVLKVT